MFKITPIQDKARQKEVCELCGAEYRPDFFAYIMYDCDSGAVMGMSQFEIGREGYISDLREIPGGEDFEAMFILGRQTMNFINLCGAEACRADKTAGEARLLRAIGFKEGEDGTLLCALSGMFDGHCDGHTAAGN